MIKKSILLLCILSCLNVSWAQKAKIDSLLQKLSVEKSGGKRLLLIQSSIKTTSESDPLLDLNNLSQLESYGRKHRDKIIEAFALSRSGYNYRSFSLEKSLEYCLKGLELAQETGNESLLAIAKMNLSYTYRDLALLVVFEFLNLLLHPVLAHVTHHNAFLMLLAMVGIAAVLVPLHHKIEHWATKKLIERNKAIRLANAKKTIEELDNTTEN